MRHVLAFGLFFASPLFAQSADKVVEADFGVTGEFDKWEQSATTYFQPLGVVEVVDDGLRLAANDKTVIAIAQRESFAAAPGDTIEITVDYVATKNTYFSLGLYEYRNRAWIKNDAGNFWLDAKENSVVRRFTITPTKDPEKMPNRAAVMFGLGQQHTLLVKRISARFVPADDAEGAKDGDAAAKPQANAGTAAAGLPSGLVLHLDATRRDAVVRDPQGKLLHWKDRSGRGHDLAPVDPARAPSVLESGLNRQAMLRFDGQEELATNKPLDLPGGLCVFLVFRREPGQQGGESWQDALYWGTGDPDNTGRYHLTVGETAGEMAPGVFHNAFPGAVKATLRIGANAGKRGFLRGDIGEVLVFDRPDLTAEEVERVRRYLLDKWDFSEEDYVRFGAAPAAARRLNHAYPLSDQLNRGGWRLLPEYSDEFEGDTLDREKWTDQVFYTLGDAPMRTLPDNLRIADGQARITTIYDPAMPSGRLTPRGPEYHSFSTGMMQSTFQLRYGYLEARAKVQASGINNAFWLIGRGVERATGRDVVPEIDIFELAAKSFAHSRSYNTALHLVQHKPEYRHLALGKNWTTDFDFAADFHVYGLEWTPETIRFYVDGYLVRQFAVRENHWDMPMTVLFTTQPHFDWFGLPDPDDFPATFAIDYLRIWKNPETELPDDDWQGKYEINPIVKTEGFAYDYYRQHGDKIVPRAEANDQPRESLALGGTGADADSLAQWRVTHAAEVAAVDGALRLRFPAVAARRANGEVQYAQPNDRWPLASLPATALATTDWSDYAYLALDFDNPSPGLADCFLRVTLAGGTTARTTPVFKSGRGTVYWRLPANVRGQAVESLQFGRRAADRPIAFSLLGLRLEK